MQCKHTVVIHENVSGKCCSGFNAATRFYELLIRFKELDGATITAW